MNQSHLSRFKLVYLIGLVAFFSAVAGEFNGLKDETAAQIAAHTWAYWVVLMANVIVGAGTSIIALFQTPPVPKQPVAPVPPPVP